MASNLRVSVTRCLSTQPTAWTCRIAFGVLPRNPNPVKVNIGETVTWVNDDSAVYTATSTDGTFDSNILRNGQTFSYTFDKEGEYPHSCTLHPNMVGTALVTSS
jgi:plastocyanin